jgi:hypothetical protein
MNDSPQVPIVTRGCLLYIDADVTDGLILRRFRAAAIGGHNQSTYIT